MVALRRKKNMCRLLVKDVPNDFVNYLQPMSWNISTALIDMTKGLLINGRLQRFTMIRNLIRLNFWETGDLCVNFNFNHIPLEFLNRFYAFSGHRWTFSQVIHLFLFIRLRAINRPSLQYYLTNLVAVDVNYPRL